MRRFLAGLVIGAVAACAGTAGSDSPKPPDRAIVTSDDPGELEDVEFDRVTVDGMPCVIWKDRRGSAQEQYAYSGLTCDWSDR